MTSEGFARDVDARNLDVANDELEENPSKKTVSGPLLEEKATLDIQLQKSGDYYYHKKSWVENIEMLLVAAIVVIGIRSFFVQPFIIPTNSMYPSCMQPYVYETAESTPGFMGRCIDKLLLGASHYKIEAESSGELFEITRTDEF